MHDVDELYLAPADRYDLIVPLWGAKYVDMFVNYGLPSQLASGNLPSLPCERSVYHIYTSQEDAKSIWTSASVCSLRKLMHVSLVTFSDEDVLRDCGLSDYRYVKNLQKMTWCYERVVLGCQGRDTAFVFMTPDSVWADGAFRYMHRCRQAGARALMALGIITHGTKLQHDLAPFTARGDGTVIDVAPRQLVTLALDALHPLAIARIVRDGGNRFHSAYYWLRPGQGFVARCFYLHPVMVWPRVHLRRIPSTVDYRYVQAAVPNADEVHIVTDSDNLFYTDMAELHHEAIALNLQNYSRPNVVDWMCEWTDAYHRKYFSRSIVVHEHDAGDAFEEQLAEAADFADSLLGDFDNHFPVSGRKLYPSNVYADIRSADAVAQGKAGASPGDDQVDAPRSPVRRVLALVLRLPFQALRLAYRLLHWKLYQRLNCLENRLVQQHTDLTRTASHVNELQLVLRCMEHRLVSFDPHKEKPEINLTPYLMRSDYELRRELERLRVELDHLLKERKSMRLLGNGNAARAIG